jgi:anti-sigma factor RsiW
VDCKQGRNLLHAYLDGELDLVRSVEVEEHLRACPTCAKIHGEQQVLRKAIGAASLYNCAPEGVRQRIQDNLQQMRPRPASRWPLRTAMGLATAAVLLVAVTLAVKNDWRGSATDGLIDQLVANHVRSLQVDHMADVASSDQHQVKPWFSGKLDYSPEVDNFASQGFPLIGGRLDYVNHRPVAAMIYGRRKHVINLFCWPATGEPSAALQRFHGQGYHLVHWVKPGMEFWAVSDLNAAELQQFAKLVQAAGTEPSAN